MARWMLLSNWSVTVCAVQPVISDQQTAAVGLVIIDLHLIISICRRRINGRQHPVAKPANARHFYKLFTDYVA